MRRRHSELKVFPSPQLPMGTFWGRGGGLAIFERLVIRRDQACARSASDGCLADGYAASIGQIRIVRPQYFRLTSRAPAVPVVHDSRSW